MDPQSLTPAPGDWNRFPGFTVHSGGADLAPGISISAWTDELEAALAMLPAVRVGPAGHLYGPWADAPRLLPHADRIVGFTAPEGTTGDLSTINGLHRVEHLSLGKVKGVDLASFPRLRFCSLDGPWDLAPLAGASSLEELHLEGSRLRTLAQLAPFRRLRLAYLWLMGRLESLDGIEGLPIEVLSMYQARALGSIAAVASLPALRQLKLDGVPALEDLAAAGGAATVEEVMVAGMGTIASLDWATTLPGLRVLSVEVKRSPEHPLSLAPLASLGALRRFALFGVDAVAGVEPLRAVPGLEQLVLNVKQLDSIGFIRGLPRLRHLSMEGDVLDGDMSPVLEHPSLTSISLGRHRKHYSHRLDPRRPVVAAAAPKPAKRKAPAARPAAPAAPVARRDGLPVELLRDVAWRFDDPADSRDALVASVARRATDDEAPAPPFDADRLVLVAPRVQVVVPGFADPADDAADDAVVALVADSPLGFTAGGLLWALHQRLGPLVGDRDHRYFEGLALHASDDRVPVYAVRLGS